GIARGRSWRSTRQFGDRGGWRRRDDLVFVFFLLRHPCSTQAHEVRSVSDRSSMLRCRASVFGVCSREAFRRAPQNYRSPPSCRTLREYALETSESFPSDRTIGPNPSPLHST